MKSQDIAAQRDAALARAVAYDFLAQALAYPADDRFEDLQTLAHLVLNNGVWMPLVRLSALVTQYSQEQLQHEYSSALTLNSSPDCPLFETAYFGADPQQQTQRMADVAGFYRAFGVDSTGSDTRPDDLSVELEFLGFLCRKEAYALEHSGPPRVAQVRKAQRFFFEEHAGRWAGVAGKKLAGLASAGMFYGAAGTALEAWIKAEQEVLGVTPEEVAGTPANWLASISHGPEFAGAASFVPMEELAVR
ncbi:MAG: molecular chaperone TorD family protein [Dehalococcoidia bacterium]|nr:molecular chaperone TorD family protein [Dehalococcoidia bacterium]